MSTVTWNKYRPGRWRAKSGWEIEKRTRGIYVVIDPDGHLVHQADSTSGAVEWVLRAQVREALRR